MWLASSLLLWCLAGIALDGEKPSVAEDFQLLQGEWELLFVECKPERTKGYYKGARLTVKGTTVVSSVRDAQGGVQQERGPFRLRPELSPRGIDFPNPYLENVAPQYGIYEVTPHILVLYYNTEPGGPRPKDFSLPKEDDHRYMMMVFRRVK
jgi:uncharacterized protein (TIGR03067 family)